MMNLLFMKYNEKVLMKMLDALGLRIKEIDMEYEIHFDLGRSSRNVLALVDKAGNFLMYTRPNKLGVWNCFFNKQEMFNYLCNEIQSFDLIQNGDPKKIECIYRCNGNIMHENVKNPFYKCSNYESILILCDLLHN